MKSKICFIIPFYGVWPKYARLWALSVTHNPNVHFLIVTDTDIPYTLGPNIRVLKEKYESLMSRLCFATGIISPPRRYHKLCDFKPFYGLAFKDELSEFNYWGYTDIDIILGDFSKVIEIINETNCDYFFTRKTPIGHCTIIKNNENCNKAGLSIKNYKEQLLLKYSSKIDESHSLHEAIKENNLNIYSTLDTKNEWKKDKPIVSVTIDEDHCLCDFDGYRYKNKFIIHCEENKVTAYCLEKSLKKKEILYIHFMGIKAKRYWKKINLVQSYPFSLTPFGLEPGLVNVDQIYSFHFRLKSYSYSIPSILYRSIRSTVQTLIPKKIIPDLRAIKESFNRKFKHKELNN